MTAMASITLLLYLYPVAQMIKIALSGGDLSERQPGVLISGGLALALHGVVCYGLIVSADGVDLSFFHIANLVAWFIAMITLFATLKASIDELLIPTYLLAALTLLAQLLFGHAETSAETLSPGVGTHVIISILAYSVLTIAAFQAVALWIQNHALKTRSVAGIINALPPLQTMEMLLFRQVAIGLGLLTVAMASGALFLDDIFAQHLAHKTAFTVIAWSIFAVLLWGRHKRGWRGYVAIRWTLIGFAALMLAYFGSKFVMELLLGR
ncbi:MAG: cytochrome c biogenesis protein CcsA [Pseudomonadales bacterium]